MRKYVYEVVLPVAGALLILATLHYFLFGV